MLVDIGSNINIIGVGAARPFDNQSRLHGHMPRVVNLERRSCANGDGSGAAALQTPGSFKIACKRQHRNEPPTTKVDACGGHVAVGSGSDLPASLGLTSTQSKRAS
eukprot:3677291-Pyramimonas_sp.AAC.1